MNNINTSLYDDTMNYSFSYSDNTISTAAKIYQSYNPPYLVTPAKPSSAGIHCDGDIECKGTLKVKGKDIAQSLEAIEQRLAILVPDPEKLEKFEALKKAYDNYKILEALCQLPNDHDKNS